jgi:hypothetical protein
MKQGLRYAGCVRRVQVFMVAVLAVTGVVTAQAEDASQVVQTGKGHLFACTDYSGGRVFIVNAEGNIEWQYEAANCNDLWVLPNGNLLFNTGHGVKEVTRDKEVVFNYESKSEIYACQRLANGNTFVGECNSGRLLEITPDGKIVKEIKLLPDGEDGGHAYIRNARVLDNGNYLVTHYAGEMVKEYDSTGKVVREIPSPGGPHSTCRLPKGNTIISCGDLKQAAWIFEIDAHDNIVWKVEQKELPDITFQFMTGFQRLPNGNTVMTNWLGHGHFGEEPHIIEVTPDKKVVWTFQDHLHMKTISSIQLLDVPGDPVKGEILH